MTLQYRKVRLRGFTVLKQDGCSCRRSDHATSTPYSKLMTAPNSCSKPHTVDSSPDIISHWLHNQVDARSGAWAVQRTAGRPGKGGRISPSHRVTTTSELRTRFTIFSTVTSKSPSNRTSGGCIQRQERNESTSESHGCKNRPKSHFVDDDVLIRQVQHI
jgi:hypothetical protein